MSVYLAPLIFTVFVWWFSTGIVLYLNRQSRPQCNKSFVIASFVAMACFVGLLQSAKSATEMYAYLAFTQALIIWGWCEMSYFMGFITGPHKSECPANATTLERFILAVKTSIYHELLVVAIAAIILVSVWGQPNLVGFWTFVILWIMRWSTKLNIFLGVANLNIDWIPTQLRYIASYTKQRSMNMLFPISIILSCYVAYKLLGLAFASQVTQYDSVSYMLLATLLGLAVLEHCFLMLPVNDAVLWKWSLKLPKADPK